MWKNAPGFRFNPNKQEIINIYLKNKNQGETCFDQDPINEIDILGHEPDAFPALSKIRSDDLEWYFYSPKVYANAKKTSMKRSTESGFWKPTCKDEDIYDKNKSKIIGIKKTLVYHKGKVTAQGVRTPWFMYEYHITCLPELPPHRTIYVLCHVKYKGHHRDISYGGNVSVVSHSDTAREMNTVPEVDQPAQYGLLLSDLSNPLDAINPTMLQQTPEDQVHQPVLRDDLPPPNAFDPNTFVNENYPNLLQQTPEVQVHQPVLRDDLPPPNAFDPNTFVNEKYPNLLQQTPEVQVDRPVQDGLYLNELSNPLDAINPNMLQQTPDVQVEQPDQDDLLMDEFISPVDLQEDHLLPPDEMYDLDTVFNYADNDYYGVDELLGHNGWNNETVIADQGFIMQENLNIYMPRKALSGTIVDCSSDSDDSAVTISATSYQGPSSSHDSVDSSSSDSCKDLQISADLSVNRRKSRKLQRRQRTVPSKQKVKRGTSRAVNAFIDKETSMVKTQKETMEINLKKPQLIYLMDMIIGFILLVSLILKFVSIVNIRTTHQKNKAVDASIDKETSMVKTEKETMETNLKKPLFIFSMNVIIGLILLVGFIGNIKYWNLLVKF